MEGIVEALVLSPFKEVVEKARIAAENAGPAGNSLPVAGEMLKAANGLSKSAGRAVAKMEPLCDKLFETYGQTFVDSLKESEPIAECRRELKDFLWEFDDYIEVDDFEADKFKELLSLIRKCAPRVEEALICMKLESVPAVPMSPGSCSAASGLWNELGYVAVRPNSQASAAAGPGVDPNSAAEFQVAAVMGAKSGPDLGLNGTGADTQALPSRNESIRSNIASPIAKPPEEPPPFPQRNPWAPGISLQGQAESVDEGVDFLRREIVPPSPSSMHDPLADSGLELAVENQDRGNPGNHSLSSSSHQRGQVIQTTAGNHPHYQQSVSPQLLSPISPISPVIATVPMLNINGSNMLGQETGAHTQSEDLSKGQSRSQLRPELDMDTVKRHSRGSSVPDTRRDSGYEAMSSANASPRSSVTSALDRSPSAFSPHSPLHGLFMATAAVAAAGAPGVRPRHQRHHSQRSSVSTTAYSAKSSPTLATPAAELASPNPGRDDPTPPIREFETGLIPVDMETASQSSSELPWPDLPQIPADLTLTSSSSFHQHKGLCEGANEIMRGGEGLKQVRKLNFGAAAVLAAKCKSCLFELAWSEVQDDRNGETRANYISKSSGLGFRLRFLIKSHLPAKNVEEQLYACLFCVRLGRTTEQSDATVFFSQRQLLAHIARHPRPLPIVPGLNVIDAEEIPAVFRNNYDLHLSQGPKPSLTRTPTREVDALPTATAIQSVKQTHGSLKLPPDHAAALQFAFGARIVGLEFPPRYGGEWAVGWHDNARAAFPAEAVRLETPERLDALVHRGAPVAWDGNDGVSAVVRWKFNNRGKEWLKLSKGETITMICWTHPKHWCWCGKTSKGKWGLFPRSHIDMGSIRGSGRYGKDVAAVAGAALPDEEDDAASITSAERRKSGVFGRLASRARAGSSGMGPSIY